MDFDVRGLLRRVAEEVEAEIRQVEKELAEVERRVRRGGAEAWARELVAIRNILYEDKWFRIATAVYTQIKRQFAEDAKAAEVIEAAKKRLFGLRLEVVEAPLLKIEAAVDREGKIAAVRCRAALDLGVEAVFTGAAPGYRLEKSAQADTGKTAGAGGGEAAQAGRSAGAGGGEAAEKIATGAEASVGAVRTGGRRRGEEEGGGLERLLEEVRREFSGLPVYVGVEEGYVYVRRTAPMDKGQFRKYTEACRRLGFRFDRRGERWVKPLEELKTT
ncbi:MAG: hypothetical protein ACO2PM_16675 [Pyrobaculum sp.]|jgi:hypothetical protein